MSEPRRLRKGEGYVACDAVGARALLACRKCFCVTFAESNKGEATFIYKEDYEKND